MIFDFNGLVMPSFDIVSETNEVELRNAVDNAVREVGTRFDFRGVEATIELKELSVTLRSESDFQVRQLEDLFRNHCTKRNVSTAGIDMEDELAFREWILKIRANSVIEPDYLTNPSSWFAEDQQALININENSWIRANSYKTRHVLARDDFHVQPVDSQRLQWPALYDLMQTVGDYLLLRNDNLPLEHLNQLMNYVFFDRSLSLSFSN